MEYVSDTKDKSGVQVVERALQLLLLISEQQKPITVAQLAEITKLNRATVWRIVGTLEQKGFVLKDSASKGYSLGFTTLKLCNNMPNHQSPLLLLARPAMQSLWEETQESITLAIYRYSSVYTLEQIHSPHSVRLKDYTHSLTPLHCSSNGKLVLANLPPQDFELFLSNPLKAHTEHTITDPALLRAEITEVKKLGYGLCHEELAENENGLSAPIYHGSEMVGFLNVSGPTFRFTRKHMKKLAPHLIEICQELSRQISSATVF